MVNSKMFLAIPPGATVKEMLEDRGMTQKELAERMDMSEKHISKFINGEVRLTYDMAFRLELVLGMPVQFWCKLESIYREKLEKIEEEKELAKEFELARKWPYAEMAKNRWVAETRDTKERVINLRKFFEVASLSLVKNGLIPGIACRRQSITERANNALIVMAQEAKKEARSIPCQEINLELLRSSVNNIRKMTTEKPEIFCGRLVKILSEVGVAIVFLPNISGSFLHGATFKDNSKIIIGLTVRGKDADRFWFSLFHEIGHILCGHLNKNGTTEEDEREADKFAQETLIPSDYFIDFITRNQISEETIQTFANQIGIDPGIVVGRLQKDEIIPYAAYNTLKTKYEMAI